MAFKIERKTLLGLWIVIGLLVATLFFIGHRENNVPTPVVSVHSAQYYFDQLAHDRTTIQGLPSEEEINGAKGDPESLIHKFGQISDAYLEAARSFNVLADGNTRADECMAKSAWYIHLIGAISQESLGDTKRACFAYLTAIQADPTNPLYQKEADAVCK